MLDGRYRLVSLLGRGGFGDVWRADELLPDGTPFRQVALKLLALHVTDAASWVEEAKLLASFRHPSLVTIYATGVFHGAWPQPFVAMELLEGSTLADVLSSAGPIAWRRVLSWAREAAAALDVIHERGVVHLDLKPANLFLAKDGTLKVLDFGIARRAAAPAPRPKDEKNVPSSALQWPATAKSDGGVSISVRPVNSAPFSKRDEEMATAAFVVEEMATAAFVEQSLGGDGDGPAPKVTPEAFAATHAMEETTDRRSRTRHVGGTTARAIIGTPGFMAPEIFEQREPSAATDAYALAVCMVVLATGKLPLAVADEPEGGWTNPTAVTSWWAAIRNATLRGEMRDFRRGAQSLPPGLTALLHKLFSVDHAERGVVPGKLRAMLDEVWERPYGVPDPPYQGAITLASEHEGMLFGRDEEITRLGRDLEHEPCVVLLGPYAVGKSSLAIAGLVPHLGKRAADGKDDFRAVVLRDPKRGDAALDEALGAVSKGLVGASIEDLVAFCETSREGLAIVIDPLEAVAQASLEPRARLGELLSLAGDGHARPGLRVVAVLGEENVEAVRDTAFGRALRASMRYVGPPAPQTAGALVTMPARLAGAELLDIGPVVSDVQRELSAPGRLPFVAQALADLWSSRERASGSKEKTIVRGERWKELRGVVGAIGRAAERALDEMNERDSALAMDMLLFFTATDGSRVEWRQDELFEAFGSEREAAEQVAAALVRAGVIRRQGGSLELIHEGLIEGWRRLQTFRASHLVRLAFVERLRESAQAWEKSAKSREMLLRGQLLTDVIARPEWMERGLVGRERELVRASLGERRRQRAVRMGTAAFGVLVVALLVIGQRVLDHQKQEADTKARKAEHEARVSDLVARSRRTDNPFSRVALIAAAMNEGSTDGLLPIELADSVADVPRALFLTQEKVEAPSFLWEDRWLVANATSATLFLVDMRPPDSEVIEDMDLDVDPDVVKRTSFSPPRVHKLRPHDEPIAERVPFSFDSSFVTRSVQGEVRVFRLNEKSEVELCAIAPMKCSGALRTAARAPIVACATEDGLAAWDLRKPAKSAVTTIPWRGAVADVAPDGSVVAGIAEKTLLLWRPALATSREIAHAGPVLLASVSPRDRVIAAVTTTAVEVHELDREAPPLLRVEHRVPAVSARWDEGGVDLGLCSRDGHSAWVYLRRGARPASEPAPKGLPCSAAPGKRIPKKAILPDDFGPYRDFVLGSHAEFEGYLLPDGRFITPELVVFNEAKRAARSLLLFHGRGLTGAEESQPPRASVAAVVRDGDGIAWQISGQIHLYDATSEKRILTRAGNLLRKCENGKVAAWSRGESSFRVFDLRSDATMGEVPREPMLVLGIDASCTTLYTQSLDGAISARPLGSPAPTQVIALADGYVYDVRLSAARPGQGTGLYMLVSSGAIVRIDDATRAVRLLTYATPRATAVADGPAPGEVLFSDATGVLLLRADAALKRVSESDAEFTVTDVAAAPGGKTVLFLAGPKLNVIDALSGERRVLKVQNHERLLEWDKEGSLLLWSSDREGAADGAIVPRATKLVTRVAEATSNLQVNEAGEVVIKQ